ncbi:hypothetical protein HK405_014476, partial [Cladochytrium tenue]
PTAEAVDAEYARAVDQVATVASLLEAEFTPLPPQGPITTLNAEAVSNVGKDGNEEFVRRLKHHIVQCDIIQAVPSQRVSRRTDLHPFNAYRQLRGLNPSPYMFYLDLGDFQTAGASPEMLVKVDEGRVFTHPIAGTRRRTPEEDEALAQDLLGELKERAEHVMLVDLVRNDVNRVNVSGRLRADCTPHDAFRSIFPAGTVSRAPKVRAMQLVGELEGDRRGVYAGAVGWFAYSGGLDTCIAIRTMVFKDGKETVNKLRSNVAAIVAAEARFFNEAQQQRQ